MSMIFTYSTYCKIYDSWPNFNFLKHNKYYEFLQKKGIDNTYTFPNSERKPFDLIDAFKNSLMQ